MKKVRDTSAAVYRELEPTLGHREQIVLDALQIWLVPPTSYELTEHLKARGLVQDVNGCRPRLTSLLAKGLVETGEKRICRITGKRSYTWRVSTHTTPAREPEAQRLDLGL